MGESMSGLGGPSSLTEQERIYAAIQERRWLAVESIRAATVNPTLLTTEQLEAAAELLSPEGSNDRGQHELENHRTHGERNERN